MPATSASADIPAIKPVEARLDKNERSDERTGPPPLVRAPTHAAQRREYSRPGERMVHTNEVTSTVRVIVTVQL
ncbi:hypothetical protein GCM10010483_28440 [Actinokineospora diospyrosa]